MKTSLGATSSTEPQPEPHLPGAWPFDQALPQLVSAFARAQGLAAGQGPDAARAVHGYLDDRARVRDTLRRLHPLELVLLEILAELGGRVWNETLFHVARARTGCDARAAAAALERLHPLLLTAALVSRPTQGEGVPIAALLAPAARHVAALVRGVTLPPAEPPPDARPTPAATARRDVLAVAGLTAHRTLRYNLDGSPNAGQLARFGKGLALPDARIDALVGEARRAGLLGAIGDAYAPIADAVLRFGAEIDGEPAAWLPEAGWTSVEAVERAVVRGAIDGDSAAAALRSAAAFQALSNEAALHVRGASGVEIVETGGGAWIRRRRAGEGGGDGHVTPSFDVLLGPRADLAVVATISLGCELCRLDRVLTFRVTPASVAAGLSAGLRAPDFLDALDRVGRHPVPSNVRAMVEDWIAQQRTASITRTWLVRVPEATADALAATDLARLILERPAPGVLALDPSLRRGQLVKLLAKHRVPVGPPISIEEAVAHRDDERYGPEGSWAAKQARATEPRRSAVRHPPLPLVFEGDPLCAEKITAARRAGFQSPVTPARAPLAAAAPASDAPATTPSTASPGPASAGPTEPPVSKGALHVEAMLAEAHAARLPDALVAGLASLGAMYVDVLPELERWAARLPPEARAPLADAFASPLTLAAFLVLTPKARQTVLGKARDLDRLLHESCRSRDFGRVSPRGAAALPLVAKAARALASQRAVPGAPAGSGEVLGGKNSTPHPFPRQPPHEVLAALREACAQSMPVRLYVQAGADVTIHDVTPSAIQPRGASSALLAVDPKTDEGRVFPVPDVIAVLRAPLPP